MGPKDSPLHAAWNCWSSLEAQRRQRLSPPGGSPPPRPAGLAAGTGLNGRHCRRTRQARLPQAEVEGGAGSGREQRLELQGALPAPVQDGGPGRNPWASPTGRVHQQWPGSQQSWAPSCHVSCPPRGCFLVSEKHIPLISSSEVTVGIQARTWHTVGAPEQVTLSFHLFVLMHLHTLFNTGHTGL